MPISNPIPSGVTGLSNQGSLAWGDYDQDGDLDLVIAGDSTGAAVTKIYRNDWLTQHPDADPIQAVKMAHIDAYVAHKAGKPVKKGPEMPSGGSSAAKGMALPNIKPEDYADLTAAQVSSVLRLLPDD